MPHRPPARGACLAVTLAIVLTAPSALAADSQPLEYNRDIRPILAENCLSCHGPDAKNRQGDLRLDTREGALADLGGRAAIKPMRPAESELLTRVRANDDDERMPPPSTKKRLTAAEIERLERRIVAGAEYQAHWAFLPPRQSPRPTLQQRDWPRRPLDHFVLARLEKEGLAPSPEADRATLIRRVSLDLIGLPPSPAEVEQFLADKDPRAYEALVDRLLLSPHFGERWARRWLDLARYADTNGYEKDRPRTMWPYRDWVVRAINADMPFDRFTIEQIAGDMLPNATPEQRIATGFHRNTMTNEEGGIDVEEFRYHSLVDRVNTTSAVWLGLTMGCVQCHSHKYDPLVQHEYYGLMALLNNADEVEFAAPQPEVARQREEIARQIAALEAARDAKLPGLNEKFVAWRDAAARSAGRWTMVPPGRSESLGHATLTVLDDRSVLVSGDKPNQDTYMVEITSPLPRVTGIRLEVLPDASLPQGGPGRAPLFSEGDFLLGEFSAEIVRDESAANTAPRPIRFGEPSHSYAEANRSAKQTIDGDFDTGWSIRGRTGEPHQAVYPLAQPWENAAGARVRITLAQRYIHQMTIGRFRISLTADDAPKASSLPAEVEASLSVDADKRTAADAKALAAQFLRTAPELNPENKQLAALRKRLPEYPAALVMQERAAIHARATRFHHRGEFLNVGDVVEPGTPAALHPFPAGAARNRLGLARWLVDPANPLVARVAVNRFWQAIFGRGLVRTTEDFGLRGEPPTHPEVLDELAVEFVRGGWSVKHLLREIVLSATYRQSSRVTPRLLEVDPSNVLMARGPRVRLEAELIRDSALAASGLLSRKLGGPSVFPPQPAGAAGPAYGGAAWTTSTGEDRYRRGLYAYMKRTSPYAAFTTFDGPSGEICLIRRERSNTPLQSLTMLNDEVFQEAAQALARRLLQDTADDATRIQRLYRMCLARDATGEEVTLCQEYRRGQLARLRSGALDARKIAGGGVADAALPEHASWALVARAVINLDEFITKE